MLANLQSALLKTLLTLLVCGSLASTFLTPASAQDGSKNRFYRGLETGIEFYTKIFQDGGWPQVPDGPVLKPGMTDTRIPILRKRLSITGDYIGTETDSPVFDDELKTAVIAYQNRNGEEPDGVVGKASLASMNIPVETRLKQMEINRERWNRMPAELGDTFVLVNMAGYELDVIEGETTVLALRVIVGKDYNSTPMFSDIIRTIEFNPYWNVPQSIANDELLPDYIKSTAKAVEQGFEVVQGGKELPLTKINWAEYEGKTLPFEIRQRPGPANALGTMKFLFPNKHNVYLHDTNARGLFSKTVRAFSHGCVRVQNPNELANYLLAANEGWSNEKLLEILQSGKNTTVKLANPIPVHLAYMTAWLGNSGFVQFRPDIYGRDAELGAELIAIPSEEL